MANIKLKRSNIDIIIAPFVPDAASATYNASVSWSPVDRDDVGEQSASLDDTIEAEHPLAASMVAIRDAAVAFLEARFGDRGQSLVTSPVSSFTISFEFEHPAAFAEDGVQLRLIGIWKPAEYGASVRPQVEVINQPVPGEHALIPSFQELADYVLTLARARYGAEHTISEN